MERRGGQEGGRDGDRDGNGGDALNQCACHISIPWDPCFLILLASWLFVLPVCPRWHLKVRSSFRGLREDTTLVGIQLKLCLIPPPSLCSRLYAVPLNAMLELEDWFHTEQTSVCKLKLSV